MAAPIEDTIIKEEPKTSLSTSFTFPSLPSPALTPVLGPKTADVVKREAPAVKASPLDDAQDGGDALAQDLSDRLRVSRPISPTYAHRPWAGMKRSKGQTSAYFKRLACIDRTIVTGNMLLHWANCSKYRVPKEARVFLRAVGGAMKHGRPAAKGPGNRPHFTEATRCALGELVYRLCRRGVPNSRALAAEINAMLPAANALTEKTMRRGFQEMTDANGYKMTYADVTKRICREPWFDKMVAEWRATVGAEDGDDME